MVGKLLSVLLLEVLRCPVFTLGNEFEFRIPVGAMGRYKCGSSRYFV